MKIIEAKSLAQIKIAAELFREYQQFLNVDLCFQGFEDELANLPGKYAEPFGAILLVEWQDQIVGCVAVRYVADKTCEMKRLYVQQRAQGHSLGRLLTEEIIKKARQLGYKKMQLDTLERLDRAIGLYSKLGFKEIQPYYSNPLDEVVYWELKL
ncbi:MAG: GNAT family N-acetyltransferase [Kangiellaceae bacterium]|nr:GNAT family N-acetyltransferase [Kangiellaceae bacterium]